MNFRNSFQLKRKRGRRMIGLGTIINVATVVLGGCIGLLLKNGLKKGLEESLMQVCGVATIFIGIGGALSQMLVFQDGKFETQGTMLLILSLVIGTLVGEVLHIENGLDHFGDWIKIKVNRQKDNLFVDGFVNVSLITCVGAMAIVGSIQDGLNGDYSLLLVKSVLDGIIALIFASTYGLGAVFSGIVIFIYQGGMTLIAAFLGDFVSSGLLEDLSFVGSVLIFCVGVNVGFGKRFRVGNMLPALLVPVVWEWILMFL